MSVSGLPFRWAEWGLTAAETLTTGSYSLQRWWCSTRSTASARQLQDQSTPPYLHHLAYNVSLNASCSWMCGIYILSKPAHKTARCVHVIWVLWAGNGHIEGASLLWACRKTLWVRKYGCTSSALFFICSSIQVSHSLTHCQVYFWDWRGGMEWSEADTLLISLVTPNTDHCGLIGCSY